MKASTGLSDQRQANKLLMATCTAPMSSANARPNSQPRALPSSGSAASARHSARLPMVAIHSAASTITVSGRRPRGVAVGVVLSIMGGDCRTIG